MGFNPNQPRDAEGRWTDTAAGRLATHGGFTFRSTGEEVDSGWAVAVPPPKGQRDWMRKKGATAADLKAFVDANAEMLRGDHMAVGGWRDPESGDDVIDVSQVTGKRGAASIALAGRQHSVYHLDSGDDIPTPTLLADAIATQPDGVQITYGGYNVIKRAGERLRTVGSGYDPEMVANPKADMIEVERDGKIKRFHHGMLDRILGHDGSLSDAVAKWLWDKAGGEAPSTSSDSKPDLNPVPNGGTETIQGFKVERRDKEVGVGTMAEYRDGATTTQVRLRVTDANGKTHVFKDDVDYLPGTTTRNSAPFLTAAEKLQAWLDKQRKENSVSLSYTTPMTSGDFDFAKHDGKLAFWKQILPQKSIHYTAKDGSRQVLDFTEEYLTDLATHRAVDKIGFLLADKDNAHTMDPERWRGEVVELALREDQPNPKHNGLWGKIVFPSLDAAKAVIDNPDLGVSARIRESVPRSDGSTVPRGIIHVLGTLDPQVSDMSPWQTADLSTEQDDILDLSNETYKETIVADKPEQTGEKKTLADYTVEDIDAMTEEELDEFLAEFVPDFATYDGEDNPEDDPDRDDFEVEDKTKTPDAAPEPVTAGAGADMSQQATKDIELANSAASAAHARADEAMRRVADAEWREERSSLLNAGVPPHALDLAAPVLNRAEDMVIDLSNTPGDEQDVNVSTVVRGLLDTLKGTVDLSSESGHLGTHSEGEDPDKPLLDRWLSES